MTNNKTTLAYTTLELVEYFKEMIRMGNMYHDIKEHAYSLNLEKLINRKQLSIILDIIEKSYI